MIYNTYIINTYVIHSGMVMCIQTSFFSSTVFCVAFDNRTTGVIQTPTFRSFLLPVIIAINSSRNSLNVVICNGNDVIWYE